MCCYSQNDPGMVDLIRNEKKKKKQGQGEETQEWSLLF
jgi:hypothetical protein